MSSPPRGISPGGDQTDLEGTSGGGGGGGVARPASAPGDFRFVNVSTDGTVADSPATKTTTEPLTAASMPLSTSGVIPGEVIASPPPTTTAVPRLQHQDSSSGALLRRSSLERIDTTFEFDPETGDYRRSQVTSRALADDDDDIVVADLSSKRVYPMTSSAAAAAAAGNGGGGIDTLDNESTVTPRSTTSSRVLMRRQSSMDQSQSGIVSRLPRRLTSSRPMTVNEGDTPFSTVTLDSGAIVGAATTESVVEASLAHVETTLEFDPDTGDYRRVTAPSSNSNVEMAAIEHETTLENAYQAAALEMSTARSHRSSSLSSSVAGSGRHLATTTTLSNANAALHNSSTSSPRNSRTSEGDEDGKVNDDFDYDVPSPEMPPQYGGGPEVGSVGKTPKSAHDSATTSSSSTIAAAAGGDSGNNGDGGGMEGFFATFLEQATNRLFGISDAPTDMEREIEHRISPVTRRVRYFFRHIMFESIWVLLILLGSIMSIFAWCTDELTELVVNWRGAIAKLQTPVPEKYPWLFTQWAWSLDPVSAFFVWWAWAVVMGFGAVLVVRYVAPQAAGSGIEQIRSIQTGYAIPGYFDANTLVAKAVGLIFTQASGLAIGKEGPFVHMSCSIGYLLLQLPMFAELKASKHLTKTVISAACATGFSSTFGAPVGGVLFALEVTSSVFHTTDYWKAFFCAVVGEMVFRELSYFGTARASQISLFPTTFSSQPYLLSELPVFLVLASLCGLYGGFYVKWIIGVRTWKQQELNKAEAWLMKMAQPGAYDAAFAAAVGSAPGTVEPAEEGGAVDPDATSVLKSGGSFSFGAGPTSAPTFWERVRAWWDSRGMRGWRFRAHHVSMRLARWSLRPNGWAFVVISFTAIVDWVTGQYMQRSLYAAINDLLVSGNIAPTPQGPIDPRVLSPDWGVPSVYVTLIWFVISKSIMCMLALSLAVPTGTLIPMLAIGLAMGRVWGEVVQIVGGASFAPGGYALVGAAAFIAGSTGAISTAVVIFEVTAELSYMVPVLIAVILGRAAGKVVSPDLYEALQISKKLPNIPPLTHQSSYKLTCAEVMFPSNIPMIARLTTPSAIAQALQRRTFRHHDEVADDDLFCIVDPQDNLYLGSVARHQLKALLVSFSGADRANEALDVLSVCNANAVAPSVPLTTPINDALFLFEITLCSTLFVTDHSRVVGWLDLNTVRHKCESGEL